MARLVGGITGRAAGTCAGVQLFRARRGPGPVTAVRALPEPPANWSTKQQAHRQSMRDIRTFLDTFASAFPPYLQRPPAPPFGWFAQWFALIAQASTSVPPTFTFSSSARIVGPKAQIPPASFKILRVSSTAMTRNLFEVRMSGLAPPRSHVLQTRTQ